MLATIGAEFYRGEKLLDWWETRLKYLNRCSSHYPPPGLISSRIWGLEASDHGVLGGMLVTAYPYEMICEQQYFVLHDTRVSVAPFGAIVENAMGGDDWQWAIELSYICIVERARGAGGGRLLFGKFVEYAEDLGERCVTFTVARGRYSHSELGERMMRLFLWDGQASSALPLDSVFQLAPSDALSVHPQSAATAHMARSSGFRHVGYSKNLGELWIRRLT